MLKYWYKIIHLHSVEIWQDTYKLKTYLQFIYISVLEKIEVTAYLAAWDLLNIINIKGSENSMLVKCMFTCTCDSN